MLLNIRQNSDTLNPKINATPIDTLNQTSAQKYSFKLFPNPTKGILFYETNIELDQIWIRDIGGKLLKTILVSKESSKKIDIEEFSNGIYFICAYSKNQELITQKIVLMR